MNSRLLHVIGRHGLVLMAFGAMVAACTSDSTPQDTGIKFQPDSTITSDKDTPAKPPMDSAMKHYISDTSTGRVAPLDADMGTVKVSGYGWMAGMWHFKDATASFTEQAMAGTTRNMLIIEAHQVPPDDHFKLYLIRMDAPIDLGNYRIDNAKGTPPRQLDASWEHDGTVYHGLEGSRGMVDVRELTKDHVAGVFEVTIVPVGGKGPTETLKGSFNVPLLK